MSTDTTPATSTTPPAALAVLDAVEVLGQVATGRAGLTPWDQIVAAAGVLLAAHSDLARRHGERGVELDRTREVRDGHRDRWLDACRERDALRRQGDALRALVGESGRYVDGIEVERILDGPR